MAVRHTWNYILMSTGTILICMPPTQRCLSPETDYIAYKLYQRRRISEDNLIHLFVSLQYKKVKSANNNLASTHIFCPFAIETAGAWHETAIEVTQEIGRRITVVTEDIRETEFLFQRLSMAL